MNDLEPKNSHKNSIILIIRHSFNFMLFSFDRLTDILPLRVDAATHTRFAAKALLPGMNSPYYGLNKKNRPYAGKDGVHTARTNSTHFFRITIP